MEQWGAYVVLGFVYVAIVLTRISKQLEAIHSRLLAEDDETYPDDEDSEHGATK